MTAPMTRRFILSRAALAGALVAVAVLVGPAGAHKDPGEAAVKRRGQ